VTANFFSLLGIKPVLGRAFLPEEDKPGVNRVAVISHQLWQRRFGGEHSIIGKEILLNGEKHNVIGVMPAGFQFLQINISLWVPIAFTEHQLADRRSHYLTVIGRMKPGVALKQADAGIRTIHRRIARDYPNEVGNATASVISLREKLAGEVERPLAILLVAVGFVLLIACANIANLLLSRAAGRQKEIAIRVALGANRARIVQQLMTESILLSILGAVIGLLFASGSFSLLEKLIPEGMALATKLSLDSRVLSYTLLISLVTGVIFGLAPALQASKPDLNKTLKQVGRPTGLGAGSDKLRSGMVVAEIALTLNLLVGDGLLIQTFYKLHNQYSGICPENLLTLQTTLALTKYSEQAKREAFYDQVLARVESLPGVISAGYTTTVPLAWKGGTSSIAIEGLSATEIKIQGLSLDVNHRQVSIDYLKTMGISLRDGRYFNESDSAESMPVAIINETMAQQYWPNGDALGKRLRCYDHGRNH
jgi:putative ABC transport system permease protein